MTEQERRLLLSCFSNGIEFHKEMYAINDKEFAQEEIDHLAEVLDDALTKTIPKKVVPHPPYASTCPECCQTMYVHEADYCWYCGQRLDWSIDD